MSVEEFNSLMKEIDNTFTTYNELGKEIQKKNRRALWVILLLCTPTLGMNSSIGDIYTLGLSTIGLIYTYRQFKKYQQEANKTYLAIKNCFEIANKAFFPRGVQVST